MNEPDLSRLCETLCELLDRRSIRLPQEAEAWWVERIAQKTNGQQLLADRAATRATRERAQAAFDAPATSAMAVETNELLADAEPLSSLDDEPLFPRD